MVTFDSDGNAAAPDSPGHGFFARTILNSDHKVLGLRYLWLALTSVLIGMFLSLLMRLHLAWPAAHIPFFSRFDAVPESYTALTILHGSLMVFFVLTIAPQAGFGNYFLPLQIGARDTAFARLSRLAFWGTVASFAAIVSSFFYTNASVGLNVYILGTVLFCLANLANALNLAVTVI